MTRQHYGRKPSKEFGAHLKRWREDASLIQNEAALRIGLQCKNPGAYLSQIELGHKAMPESALLNVPEVYGVSPEEVLRRAYTPQLPLFLLTAIMEPASLPKAIEDYLGEIEKQLEEDEMKELTRYAALLLLRRTINNQQENSARSEVT